MSKTVGYIRVSSKDQCLERQLSVLKALGKLDGKSLKEEGLTEKEFYYYFYVGGVATVIPLPKRNSKNQTTIR